MVADLILILLRMELIAGDLFNQLNRKLQFGWLDFRVGDFDVTKAAQFFLMAELNHDETLVQGMNHHKIALAPCGIFGQRRFAGPAHGLCQQLIASRCTFVRTEEVGLFDIQCTDLFGRDKLGDIDLVGGLGIHGLDLFGCEQHKLTLGKLIALHAVGIFHQFPVGCRYILLLQPGAILAQHVEMDGPG